MSCIGVEFVTHHLPDVQRFSVQRWRWISVGIRMSRFLIEICWQVIALPDGLLLLYGHFHWRHVRASHAAVSSSPGFTVLLQINPERCCRFSVLILFSSVLLCSPCFRREWDRPVLMFLSSWAERLELFHNKFLYSCCAPGTQIIGLELRILKTIFSITCEQDRSMGYAPLPSSVWART